MSTLAEKITAARAALDTATPTELPVEIGGEIIAITLRPVTGETWNNLIATHPPRAGAALDNGIGYNLDDVVRDYPTERVTIDNEPVDPETWADLIDTLPSPSRKNLGTAIWGLNEFEPQQRLKAALDQRMTS